MMHARIWRQASPCLRRHGIAPRPVLLFIRALSSKQPPRDHRRQESSVARSFPEECGSASETRPFAIERVGGRECHVSWSDSGTGIEKEWRDVAASEGKVAVAGTNSVTGRISAWFRQMFLPTNYPQSVHDS